MALLAWVTGRQQLTADPAIQVDHGFGGYAPAEKVTPVRVSLQGDEMDRELLVRITGTPGVQAIVELPRATRKRITLYTEPYTELVAGQFPLLEVFDGDQVVFKQSIITRSDTNARFMPFVGSAAPQLPGILTPVVRPRDLPTDVRGYAGIDALAIAADACLEIPPAALRALVVWARAGGRIVLMTLDRGIPLSLPPSHPFGPVSVGRATTHERQLGWLSQIHLNGPAVDLGLPAPDWDQLAVTAPPAGAVRLFPPAGSGEEGEDDLETLWARRRFGRGDLFFACFDMLAIPESKRWKRRDVFFGRMFDGRPTFFRSEGPLATVRGVPRDFVNGTGRTATELFFAFLVAYLVVIVPVDYWFVRKLRRPRLTWLTFPAAVLAFSFAAWGLGRDRISGVEYHEVVWVDAYGPVDANGNCPTIASGICGVYADTNQSFTFVPTDARGEVWVNTRSSGGAAKFDDREHHAALSQKMHIWSSHDYRVLWEAEPALASAVFVGTDDGAGKVIVRGALPRSPVVWIVSVNSELHVVPHRDAEEIEGGWEFRVDAASARGVAVTEIDWDSIGGRRTAHEIAAYDAEALNQSSGGGAKAKRWVAALAPGTLPALRIVERSPPQSGLTVFRVGIEVVGAAPATNETE